MGDDLYARRGVSAEKDEVHAAVKDLDKGLYPNAFCKVLPDLLAGSPEHCLALHTDTAGTKPILAYLLWKETGDLSGFRNVVEDALVMNLDDLAAAGFTDNFIVSSNIARNAGRIPGEVLAEVIAHTQHYLTGLAAWGITATLAGGETADVGDLVRTLDVGYTVLARTERKKVVQNALTPGLAIVGLESHGTTSYDSRLNSGIGSNGLTSARHDLLSKYYAQHFPETFEPSLDPAVVYNGTYRLTDIAEGERVADLLLSPTRTYLPFLKKLLAEHHGAVRGIIHNTGGGQTKVLPFAKGLHIIKDKLPPPPPVFRHIQRAVPTPWEEMYRTFNMGIRLEVYCPPQEVATVLGLADSFGLKGQAIGRVEANSGPGARLSLKHIDDWFTYHRG